LRSSRARVRVYPSARLRIRFPWARCKELGRRGGVASGEARRFAGRRAIERKILESPTGIGAATLLRLNDVRERQAARDQRHWDQTVCELMDDADAERATIEQLKQQRDETREELWAERDKLRDEIAALRATCETGEGLAALLTVAHERGLLVPALQELDLFEESDE
jgi:hypothetical protein